MLELVVNQPCIVPDSYNIYGIQVIDFLARHSFCMYVPGLISMIVMCVCEKLLLYTQSYANPRMKPSTDKLEYSSDALLLSK